MPNPIDFAPEIPYNGVEDVRFTPGWDNEKSEQYWSYSYLWWLQGKQKINAALLQKYLEACYQGLVGRNITRRNIPADKVVPTKVAIERTKKEADEAGPYSGTIRMLDYMAQKPIILNFLVQVRNCKAQNKTAVFIQISPQPYTHPLWDDLNRITRPFDGGN